MSEEKWAVITGASQGIGRAMAAEAARRGLNLLLIALPETGLRTVADELSRLYDVESEYWEFDLSDSNRIADFTDQVAQSQRSVELLVNNAGVGGTTSFVDQSPDLIAAMINVNVGALTLLTRGLLPQLIANGDSHILNVASLAGWYPSPGMSTYAATKAFVISFSLALRDELEGSGVSVSVLCPSGVITKEEVIKALSAQGFLGRATSRYPDQLARYALSRTYRRHRILVPGPLNKLLRIAGRIMPLRLLTKVVGSRFGTHPAPKSACRRVGNRARAGFAQSAPQSVLEHPVPA